MKKFVKYIIDATVVKILRYLNAQLPIGGSSPYKLNTHQILWEKAILESSNYVESRLSDGMLFKRKQQLWDHALSQFDGTEGLCLEFGVFEGESINYFSSKKPNCIFYGFDSFEGLAEDWVGSDAPKGTFNLDGVLPKVRSNVTLIAGWFDETVPVFLRENSHKNLTFVHIDGDTYQAAKIVLNSLSGRLDAGTIIIFDEYLGYPSWQNGEFKAWKEFVEENNIDYKYIGFCTEQVAIQIL